MLGTPSRGAAPVPGAVGAEATFGGAMHMAGAGVLDERSGDNTMECCGRDGRIIGAAARPPPRPPLWRDATLPEPPALCVGLGTLVLTSGALQVIAGTAFGALQASA